MSGYTQPMFACRERKGFAASMGEVGALHRPGIPPALLPCSPEGRMRLKVNPWKSRWCPCRAARLCLPLRVPAVPAGQFCLPHEMHLSSKKWPRKCCCGIWAVPIETADFAPGVAELLGTPWVSEWGWLPWVPHHWPVSLPGVKALPTRCCPQCYRGGRTGEPEGWVTLGWHRWP